jgi:hypothetical protein
MKLSNRFFLCVSTSYSTKKFDELIETLELMCIMPLVFEEKDTLSQFFQDPRLLESQRLQERLPEFTERLLRQVCVVLTYTEFSLVPNMRTFLNKFILFSGSE